MVDCALFRHSSLAIALFALPLLQEKDVDNAVVVVGELLRPVDDGLNQHKQRQLRELALINGTLRTVLPPPPNYP
jgi:hypothetical protein